jgi:hypothetical protein
MKASALAGRGRAKGSLDNNLYVMVLQILAIELLKRGRLILICFLKARCFLHLNKISRKNSKLTF